MVDHPTHPHHETALMLLRAAKRPKDGYSAENFLSQRFHSVTCGSGHFFAMAAAVDAREKAMWEALEKMAKQKLQSELTDDEWNNGDFHDAYDQFIMTARDALATRTRATP